MNKDQIVNQNLKLKTHITTFNLLIRSISCLTILNDRRIVSG